MSISGAIAFASLILLSSGEEPQWSGFRGNNGTGVSTSKGLPEALDPETNLIWRTEVPTGYSSPSIAGKSLFLTAAEGPKLWTLCLDSYSGEEKWRKELDFDGKRPGMNSSAAPTPVTDGERVYAFFHHAGLIAYDARGEELWRKPIGPFQIPHGMSSSPVLHGDVVVLQVDQDVTPYLVAFDKKTGEEKWKVERPGVVHGYATPAIYVPKAGSAQVIASSSFQIAGFSVASGEKLWWVDGAAWQTKAVPVIDGERCYVNSFTGTTSEFMGPKKSGSFADLLKERDADGDGKIAKSEWNDEGVLQLWFLYDLDEDGLLDASDWEFAVATDSATGGLFAIDLTGKGDVTKSHVKWRIDDRRGLPDATSPLLYDGTLYLVKEGGILTAIDPESGAMAKQGRVGSPDEYYASPVAGDGKLYLASQSGQLVVVRAGREWEELAAHTLDEEVWSTPALVGGQVFVRSQKALYCFETAQ